MNLRDLKDRFQKTFSYILKSLSIGYEVAKKELIYSSILQLFLIPIPLAQAYLAKLIMDQISLKLQNKGGDTNLVLMYLGMEALLVFCPNLLNLKINDLKSVFRIKLDVYFKEKFFKKLLELDIAYIEDPKINNEIYEMRFQNREDAQKILSAGFSILSGLFVIVSFFGLLLSHNVLIALFLLIVTFISFYTDYQGSQASIKDFKQHRQSHRKMWYLEELLVNMNSAKEIKSLDTGNHLYNSYAEVQKEVLEAQEKRRKERENRTTLVEGFSTVLYYFSYGWIVLQTIQNHLSLGDMTMFLMLFTKAQGGFNSVFGSLVRVYEVQSKLKTMFDFWALPVTNKSAVSSEVMEKLKENFKVEFKQVSFGYSEKELILKDFNLTIEPGKKVALVGENGAGKTTIIKILLGLYQPLSGEVLIGGINLKEFSRSQIHEIMGVVFQDFLRLSGTIKENITLGNLQYSEEEYERAKSLSGVDELIKDFKGGDNQGLGRVFGKDSKDLSGGQWQKIALARAFIQTGKILILDEPTSAIDAKQEQEIFEKIQNLTKDKTTILVSHRFASVRMADEILFLEHGEIKERGTHEQLMAQEGQYALFFNLQAKGYK